MNCTWLDCWEVRPVLSLPNRIWCEPPPKSDPFQLEMINTAALDQLRLLLLTKNSPQSPGGKVMVEFVPPAVLSCNLPNTCGPGPAAMWESLKFNVPDCVIVPPVWIKLEPPLNT